MIYLDNAATTKPSQEAIDNFVDVSKHHWGNPSSMNNSLGQNAHSYLDEARRIVAECIGAEPEQIIFTSGSTEGANTIIQGQIPRGEEKNWCIVTTAMEHPCVYNTAKYMETCGVALKILDNPVIDLHEFAKIIADVSDAYEHVLVCIMEINNETGMAEPIDLIAKVTAEYPNVLLFTDMTQSVAHMPSLDVKALGIDFAIASAHKFNGFKGVGFIYVKEPSKMRPFMYGGHQEFGLRPGTENVAGIYSMALELQHARITRPRVAAPMERLLMKMVSKLEPTRDCFMDADNIISMTFDGVDANKLITMLDLKGIIVSAGSACSTGENKPSRILKALGYTDEEAQSTIRVSLDANTTESDVDKFIAAVKEFIVWAKKEE